MICQDPDKVNDGIIGGVDTSCGEVDTRIGKSIMGTLLIHEE
jgi:hypothetical protein